MFYTVRWLRFQQANIVNIYFIIHGKSIASQLLWLIRVNQVLNKIVAWSTFHKLRRNTMCLRPININVI